MVITQYNMVITIGISIITQYQHTYVYCNWLVVWNIWIIFPYIGNKIPNWRTYIFQRGWNHQPVVIWLLLNIGDV